MGGSNSGQDSRKQGHTIARRALPDKGSLPMPNRFRYLKGSQRQMALAADCKIGYNGCTI